MKDKNLELLKEVLPDDSILSQCIHCGMCLTTCPTYDLTKLERSSPRGRIKLINSVANGTLPITSIFADEMDFCLNCQACETACPAGVQYGLMLEAARVVVDDSNVGNKLKKFLKRKILKYIVASRNTLKFISKILYYYQNSGLQKIVRKLGVLKVFSNNLYKIEKTAPNISKAFSRDIFPEKVQAKGKIRYKLTFLTGCLMDVMFGDVNIDTIEVLSILGNEIKIPKGQVCCGSLSAHNGDIKTAIKLAKKNIDEFLKHDYDFLVSNSAGCGAFMKQYGYLLKDDPDYNEKAKKFADKVKDISEFIAENEFDAKWGKIEEKITYHDACHLVHSQKLYDQPRKMLNKIPGLVIREMNESTWCCGSAGIYNVLRYNDSMKILDRKVKNIIDTNAKIVVTGNPGCISQIKNGMKMEDKNIQVLHPVTLLKHSLTRAEIDIKLP